MYLWDYKTFDDVKKRIPYFIEEVYNEQWLHLALGYCPPNEYESLVARNNKRNRSPLSHHHLYALSISSHPLCPLPFLFTVLTKFRKNRKLHGPLCLYSYINQHLKNKSFWHKMCNVHEETIEKNS
jgi:hypothetical protein